MKKGILYTIIGIIALIIIALVLLRIFACPILSKTLTDDFGVKTTIEKLSLSTKKASFSEIVMQNPPKSKSKEALSCEIVTVSYSLSELLGKKLTIDEIDIKNLHLGIELYDKKGKSNNWSKIMALSPPAEKQKKQPSQKQWLIKKMSIKDINVTLTQSNGKTKKLMKIPLMEFNNLSNETGFPIDEIETAIIKEILKQVFLKQGLNFLLETLDPIKMIPDFVPIPFFNKKPSPAN
jgi:hypothetical protein